MHEGDGTLWPTVAGQVAALDDTDRVEFKVIVAARHRDEVLCGLNVDRRRSQTRQVYFLDTPELALIRCGVVVRARRTHRGRAASGDSVVKLRRTVGLEQPVDLPKRMRRSPNLTVELDALPGSSVWSAALKRRLPPSAVRAAVDGRRRLRTLLSAEQRAFLLAHTPGAEPDGGAFDLDQLMIHGPVRVVRMPAASTGFGARTVVENWVYPDGSHLLELSVKCRASRARRVAARARGFLAKHGITPAAQQPTKTQASLDYFAG